MLFFNHFVSCLLPFFTSCFPLSPFCSLELLIQTFTCPKTRTYSNRRKCSFWRRKRNEYFHAFSFLIIFKRKTESTYCRSLLQISYPTFLLLELQKEEKNGSGFMTFISFSSSRQNHSICLIFLPIFFRPLSSRQITTNF